MALEVTVWSAHLSSVGLNRMSGDDSVDKPSCIVLDDDAMSGVFVRKSLTRSHYTSNKDKYLSIFDVIMILLY